MASGKIKEFHCSWAQCSKSFDRQSDLRRHYRIHINERPYHCTFNRCNKSFIQRSALTVHLRTHTGEKPYRCAYNNCQRAFSDSSSFARHGQTHTNQQHSCDKDACGKSFRRKSGLIRHQHRSHPENALLTTERLAHDDSNNHTQPEDQLISLLDDNKYTGLIQQPYTSYINVSCHEHFHPQGSPWNRNFGSQSIIKPQSIVDHSFSVESTMNTSHVPQQTGLASILYAPQPALVMRQFYCPVQNVGYYPPSFHSNSYWDSYEMLDAQTMIPHVPYDNEYESRYAMAFPPIMNSPQA